MNKTWTVFKSEYLRRVTSKSFILTTLLVPIGIAVLIAVVVFLSIGALEDAEHQTVAVLDQTNVVFEGMESDDLFEFTEAMETEEALRQAVIDGTYDGYLVLPSGLVAGTSTPTYYTKDGNGNGLRSRIERVVRAQRLDQEQVSAEVIELINKYVSLETIKLTEAGEEAGSSEFFIVLGFGMGFLIFMMMIIYGGVVMQSVIDEKNSRVVEVIISSVKPFQLMMGKILAVGSMGLTQFIAWIALIFGATSAVGTGLVLIFGTERLAELGNQSSDLPVAMNSGSDFSTAMAALGVDIPTIAPELFVWFALYFLFGYLFFGTIYAGVGSLVENPQDAQGYTLPIMLPLILAMYTLVPQVESPNSTLAVTFSMLPFTSPISMMVRMAVTDVPFWQMLVSFILLVGAFVGGTWLSARIYRIGILMYGKKPKFSEVIRWIKYA